MRRSTIRKASWIKAIGALLSLGLGFSVLTACDTVDKASDTTTDAASQVQDAASAASDTASKAGEIINDLPTSPSDVRDKITDSFQKATIVLDADTCSQTDGVELHVKGLGSNWPVGRYVTVAEQSATKNGTYKPVDETTYAAFNPDGTAYPTRTWHWNCGIPKDHLGYLRFSIVHLDINGKPDMATKWAYAKVVA